MSVGTLAGTVWVNVLPKMDAFQKSVSAGMAGLEKRTAKAGKTLRRHVTLPLLAMGAASVKMAVDFDAVFDQMVGLAGVPASSIAKLKTQVLDLATATGKAPKDLAEGLYFIESSGLKGKKAMDALTVSAKLSAAGLGDTQTVADAITSAMNAYAKSNLTAAQAGDVLAATVRDGKGEAQAIAPVLGGLLPLAGRLGISFDQVGASIASMTLLGTSAPEAGTALSGFMTSLLTTSPKAVKALKSVNLSFKGLQTDLATKGKGLPYVLKELETAFHGNIKKMHEAFPNIRGLRALLALTGDNGKKTLTTFQDLAKSAGSIGTAFGAVKNDKAFEFKRLQAQLQVLAITLGEQLLPPALQFADFISGLIKDYQQLSPAQQDLILKVAGFLAVVGPGLSVLSRFFGLFSTATQVIGYVAKAFIDVATQALTAGAAQTTSAAETTIAATANQTAATSVGLLGQSYLITSEQALGAAAAQESMAAQTLTATAAVEDATVAQGELNVAMDSNPIGAVLAAVGLVAGAFLAFSSGADNTTSSLDRARQAADELRTAMSQLAGDFLTTKEASLNLKSAQLAAKVADREEAKAVHAASKAHRQASRAIHEHGQSSKQARTAIRKASDASLAASQATLREKQAHLAVKRAVDDLQKARDRENKNYDIAHRKSQGFVKTIHREGKTIADLKGHLKSLTKHTSAIGPIMDGSGYKAEKLREEIAKHQKVYDKARDGLLGMSGQVDAYRRVAGPASDRTIALQSAVAAVNTVGAVTQVDNLKSSFAGLRDMAHQAADAATAAVLAAQAKGSKGKGAKHHARGGYMARGELGIVGEVGPELFVPATSGRIIPNNQLATALGRSGGRTALTITNWNDGTGFIEDVAEGSVGRAAALRHQRRRMRR